MATEKDAHMGRAAVPASVERAPQFRGRKRLRSPSATLPRVPEKAEQAHIIKLLRSLGASVYVLGHPSPNDGRRFRGTGQTPGIPDLWFSFPSAARSRVRAPLQPADGCGWIEVKAAGGSLSDAQRVFQSECLELQAVTHLVGGLNTVIAWLMAVGYLKADCVPHYRLP